MTVPDDSATSAASPDDTDRTRRALHAISLIDLTDLSDDHSSDGIDDLCARAVQHGTAAVCVWPEFVERCVSLVGDSGVGVATVVNFPQGTQQVGAVLDETLTALSDGATDIDVVLPYRAFLAGDVKVAADLLQSVGDLVAPPGIVKVILETGELERESAIREAAELAVGLGADFLKTSTGKTSTGATIEAATTMLDVISQADRTVGLKPSGGIRTADEAFRYLDVARRIMGDNWAQPATFRFGASALLDDLVSLSSAG